MPLELGIAHLSCLGSPSKSQKASELSLSGGALILGLVLEFDLLKHLSGLTGAGELKFSRD